MIELLAIAGCGLFDRLRGTHGSAWMPAYGLCVAFLAGYWPGDWWVLGIIFGLWLGELSGWGYNLGQVFGTNTPESEPERYQRWFPILERHPYAGLAARGAIWGAPTLQWEIILAFAVAMPLASWLALLKYEGGRAWEVQEIYRGLLAGLLTWGLSHV